MQSVLKAKLLWGTLVVGSAGIALLFIPRGPSIPLPKDENAFLSYLQSARALTRIILDPPPLLPEYFKHPKEDRKEQLAKACQELEELQAKVLSLSESDRKRLAILEKELIGETNTAWAEICRRHRENPAFPETDWPRLEKGFQVCRELESAGH